MIAKAKPIIEPSPKAMAISFKVVQICNHKLLFKCKSIRHLIILLGLEKIKLLIISF